MDRCAECGTRAKAREYFRTRRLAGGNYRTAAHHRRSTICDRCLDEGVAWAQELGARGSGSTYWGACRWDLGALCRLRGLDDLARRIRT